MIELQLEQVNPSIVRIDSPSKVQTNIRNVFQGQKWNRTNERVKLRVERREQLGAVCERNKMNTRNRSSLELQ
ncbi:hypothetical protein QLX08_005714 [Tetragonisca angustula]|uniref:Uncharacterized protein n=1 Tax=Tetragonisca angustula TaxID=166442 RepID=A0AAW0ZX89_9HYME